MKKQICSKQKNKSKTSGKNLNDKEISNLPNKGFKIMVTKMLTKFRRKLDEHSENNKENKVPNKSQG